MWQAFMLRAAAPSFRRSHPSRQNGLPLAATLALCICLGGCSSSGSGTTKTTPPPPSPAGLGGSNYGWYYLAPPCNREPYGVVYNYNTATATIDSQLQQMYNNGQRRLRIPIYHARGINSGTIMDSTGGTLAPQFLSNLKPPGRCQSGRFCGD